MNVKFFHVLESRMICLNELIIKLFDPIVVSKTDLFIQLLDVLDGQYAHLYDQHLIVDCRFPYEFEGGHIAGAVNVNTWDALESYFLDTPPEGKVVVIFHCEYSAHRAPRLYFLHPTSSLTRPKAYMLQGTPPSQSRSSSQHASISQ